MNVEQFIFRNKEYSCSIYIDSGSEGPFYVFVDLLDKELINEFGDEVTIKTDFKIRLSKQDDYPAIAELRQAIFNAIQTNQEFITAKNKNTTRLSHAISVRTSRRTNLKKPLVNGMVLTNTINNLTI